jgi:glutaredoxin
MSTPRKIDVYTTGCPLCEEAVTLVRRVACDSCEVEVHDLTDAAVAERAVALGVRSVPAVVVDGALAGCCRSGGVTEAGLREAGVGQAA